jgi:hypothetical protein
MIRGTLVGGIVAVVMCVGAGVVIPSLTETQYASIRESAATGPTSVQTVPATSTAPALSTPQPSATSALVVRTAVPTPTMTSEPTGTPSISFTATPSATASPTIRFVGDTGGVGVRLRTSAKLNAPGVGLADATRLEVLGPSIDQDGEHWLYVRAPGNQVGWVSSRYLVSQ